MPVNVKMPGGMFFFGLTRLGCAYLIFVLLVSAAAVGVGGNALYALLAVTLSAVVVSGIISRNTLKQMALTLQTPDRIFAGKTVITRVSLTNTKRLFPSMAIFVGEMKPNAKNTQGELPRTAFFPILRAGETRSARLEQTFPRRGRRRQTLQVITRFPFGFFQRRDPLPSQELLVYPAIGKFPEFLQIDALQGRRESRRRGTGENFYSIRQYQEGESARAIDWKATAKARKLMAREYAREDEIRCLLILDTHTAEENNAPGNFEEHDQPDELFEKAVSLAAGLAVNYINGGAALEFFTPEVYIPADSGGRQMYHILEALAVTRRQTETALFPIADQVYAAQDAESGALGAKTKNTERKPGADLQKLISNQTFSVILTPLPEESFPAGIRRFARIVSFNNFSGGNKR
jgi:uncharacterized protein (DUF58 family)